MKGLRQRFCLRAARYLVSVEPEPAFRHGNEVIADAARRAGVDGVKIDFICECADLGCLARVPLDLRTYERIRANGGAIALPDHDSRA
jgi:hypothetical protein